MSEKCGCDTVTNRSGPGKLVTLCSSLIDSLFVSAMHGLVSLITATRRTSSIVANPSSDTPRDTGIKENPSNDTHCNNLNALCMYRLLLIQQDDEQKPGINCIQHCVTTAPQAAQGSSSVCLLMTSTAVTLSERYDRSGRLHEHCVHCFLYSARNYSYIATCLHSELGSV